MREFTKNKNTKKKKEKLLLRSDLFKMISVNLENKEENTENWTEEDGNSWNEVAVVHLKLQFGQELLILHFYIKNQQ